MRVFLTIKYAENHDNRDHIAAILDALAAIGWSTVCIARDLERWGQVTWSPQELMRKTFAEIDSCDLMVVDLTVKGVGIGIEAGYAYARQMPVLAIAQRGSDISATLRGISCSVVEYDRPTELGGLLRSLSLDWCRQ